MPGWRRQLRTRTSIKGLMAAVLLFAVGFAGLRSASALWSECHIHFHHNFAGSRSTRGGREPGTVPVCVLRLQHLRVGLFPGDVLALARN